MGEPSFDTSEFLKIKREVPDELPPPTENFVDLDQHSTDFSFPPMTTVKVSFFLVLKNNISKGY